MKFVQASEWMPDNEKMIIFTGNDRALINSLVRIFRHNTELLDTVSIDASNREHVYGDSGIFDNEIDHARRMVILEDMKISQIKEVFKNEYENVERMRYIIILENTSSGIAGTLQTLTNDFSFAKHIIVVLCDTLYKNDGFVKIWSNFFKREYLPELAQYAWNLDILKHCWELLDDGLSISECKQVLRGYERSKKEAVTNHYSWFLQNLYLKKRDI